VIERRLQRIVFVILFSAVPFAVKIPAPMARGRAYTQTRF
jgi:hypothetical protein